jgi:hypothetical protein
LIGYIGDFSHPGPVSNSAHARGTSRPLYGLYGAESTRRVVRSRQRRSSSSRRELRSSPREFVGRPSGRARAQGPRRRARLGLPAQAACGRNGTSDGSGRGTEARSRTQAPTRPNQLPHPNAPRGLSPVSEVFSLSDGVVHQYPMELSQHQPLVLNRQRPRPDGG